MTFRDEKQLEVIDVNQFAAPLVEEIQGIAAYWTQSELQSTKEEVRDLECITEDNKQVVIDNKNRIMQPHSSSYLHDKKIVHVTFHSLERIFQRVSSIGRGTFIDLIDRIRATNNIAKAQWKGYSTISYTLTEIGDPEEYKFPMSLILKSNPNKDRINIITVIKLSDDNDDHNRKAEQMEQRIFDDPKHKDVLAKMQERFKNN